MRSASLFAIVLLTASSTRAFADDVAAASRAFSQAQRAMLSGKHSRAADLFELADSLAPSAVALRSAARARFAAGHLASAATHAAELLRRYPAEKQSRAFAEQILERLAPKLARVWVRCSSPCTIEVGGHAVAAAQRREHAFFLHPGKRTVVANFRTGKQATATLAAVANAGRTLRFEEPPEPVAPAAAPASLSREQPLRRSEGVRKRWFIGAAVATVGLGTAATMFGLATLEARDDIRRKVTMGNLPAAESAYASAETTQLMTNLFLAGTAVAGVVTVTLALLTDWSGGHKELNVQPTRGGLSLLYGGRF